MRGGWRRRSGRPMFLSMFPTDNRSGGEFGATMVLRAYAGQTHLSKDASIRLSEEEYNLAHRILVVATGLSNPDDAPWSQAQRGWLQGNGLNVELRDEETSMFQVAAGWILGCVTATDCLTPLGGTRCDTACQRREAWDAFHPAFPPSGATVPVAQPLPDVCGGSCLPPQLIRPGLAACARLGTQS
jgi:hypothetical protein